MLSGNVKLAMSHVVPDLVQKVLKGQDPLHILGQGNQVRHYTYGGDLARGIVATLQHPAAVNEDFNLSTAQSTSVAELAEVIWPKIKGPACRCGWPAMTPTSTTCKSACRTWPRPRPCSATRPPPPSSQMLDEVIPWIEQAVHEGRL